MISSSSFPPATFHTHTPKNSAHTLTPQQAVPPRPTGRRLFILLTLLPLSTHTPKNSAHTLTPQQAIPPRPPVVSWAARGWGVQGGRGDRSKTAAQHFMLQSYLFTPPFHRTMAARNPTMAAHIPHSIKYGLHRKPTSVC